MAAAILIGGPILCGMIQGSINSTSGIASACEEFETAEKNYQEKKAEWDSILLTQNNTDNTIKTYSHQLLDQTNALKSVTENLRLKALQQQRVTEITLICFVLLIFIALLIKRIDLFGKIKQIF